MGRPHLTVLPGWDGCERCPRHAHRLGVLAPTWSVRPRILVLTLRATRASQAVGDLDPRVEAFARELEGALQLERGDVATDVLLACGLGHEVSVDDVAACSARLVENQRKWGSPELVLLVGPHTAAVARGAGLLTADPSGGGERWAPVGVSSCPIERHDQAVVTNDLLDRLAHALGVTRTARPRRRRVAVLAPLLKGALGEAEGCATRGLVDSHWVRRKRTPLTEDMIAGHLRRSRFVAPFRPKGPWPFVVIDIDRHDALQAAHFDETIARVKSLFPRSLWIRSSESGGFHVYVRLPPDTTYADAASWLEYYFAWKKLLFIEKVVKRPGGRTTRLRSARLEVPSQPVRLPFGAGSGIDGSTASLKARVDAFCRFVTSAPFDEFERARAEVAAANKKKVFGGPAKRRRLAREVERAMVADLAPVKLESTDPWASVLADLDAPLRVVATRGVPALGTRTRWTERLVDTLFSLKPPDEVERLMLSWLYEREHASEDIEVDLMAVEQAIVAAVAERKRKVVGVPERVWTAVEAEVLAAVRRRSNTIGRRPVNAPVIYQRPKLEQEARRAAFFVCLEFFSKRRHEVRLSADRFFARFVPKDDVAELKEILLEGTWLKSRGWYIAGKQSTTFWIAANLWPLIPGEPVRWVP